MSTRSLRLPSAESGTPMPELLADGEQELRRRHLRIEDQGDLGVLRRLRQQRAHDGGLAGADLAGELHEAAGLVDAVQQVRQRLGVPLAEVEIARIRSDRERLLVEAEKGQIHATMLLDGAAAPQRPAAEARARLIQRGIHARRAAARPRTGPAATPGVSSVRTTPSSRSFAPGLLGEPAAEQLRGHLARWCARRRSAAPPRAGA